MTITDAAGQSVASSTRVTVDQNVAPPSTVAGRYAFYNNSFYDGNDAGASAADDAAIDPNVLALTAGKTSSASNMTDYDKGINGIMIDVAGLPAGYVPTAADFSLLAGNTAAPSGWTSAPAVASVSVRRGAGVNGSDRVTLTLADYAVVNQWLQVRVRGNANTGLAADDVFYFGNLVADTNGSGLVNSSDVGMVKYYAGLPTTVSSAADVNKNGVINSSDVGQVKYWAGVATLPPLTA